MNTVVDVSATPIGSDSNFSIDAFVPTVNFFCNTLENTFAFDSKSLNFFEPGTPKDYGLYLTEQHSVLFLNSCSCKHNADLKTITPFTALVLLHQKNNESNMLDLTINEPRRVESHFRGITKDQINTYLKSVHDLNTFLKNKFSDNGILKSLLSEDSFSPTLKPKDLIETLKVEVELIKTLMCLVSTQFIYVSTAILLKRPLLKDFFKTMFNE